MRWSWLATPGGTVAGLVRLGRVARELLHLLPAPVVVVPHDLRAADLGTGPVVVLTSLGEHAVDAVRFARRVATRLGRGLVVAHAVPFAVNAEHATHLAKAREALVKWVAAHGIDADHTRVVEGSAFSRSVELARELHAPLLVTGAIREDGELPRFTSQLGTSRRIGTRAGGRRAPWRGRRGLASPEHYRRFFEPSAPGVTGWRSLAQRTSEGNWPRSASRPMPDAKIRISACVAW